MSTLEVLREALLELPGKIKVTQESILKNSNELDELNLMNKTSETRLTFDITKELDDSGKKKYKNDMERSKALEELLSVDNNYNSNKEKILKLSQELKLQDINFSFLKRKFRAAEAIARLGVD